MRKRWLLALLAIPFLMAGGFNAGSYPGFYNSAATLTTPFLAANGVIYGGPSISMYAVCEFYNSAASAQDYIVYNSPTVAGQLPANIIGATQCAATSFCYVQAGGPSGPAVNAAIVAPKGLSWAASSTFPAKTAPSANSWAGCTF